MTDDEILQKLELDPGSGMREALAEHGSALLGRLRAHAHRGEQGNLNVEDVFQEAFLGGRELVDARLVVVDHDAPPPWMQWPGRWGASVEGPFASPRGPVKQEKKWTRPDEFHGELRWFVDRSAERRRESGVPRRHPDVTVDRLDDRVVVTYTTPYDDPGLWTAELRISAHEGNERRPLEQLYLVTGDEARPSPIQSTA